MNTNDRFLNKASQIKVKKINPATIEIRDPNLEILFQ
jgi:hypothetical protein